MEREIELSVTFRGLTSEEQKRIDELFTNFALGLEAAEAKLISANNVYYNFTVNKSSYDCMHGTVVTGLTRRIDD